MAIRQALLRTLQRSLKVQCFIAMSLVITVLECLGADSHGKVDT